MAGVTDQGFEGKRLADVVSDADLALADVIDPVSGNRLQPNLNGDDPAMQIAKVPLDAIGQVWELSEAIVDQFDPAHATGPLLRGLVELNGLSAQAAVASSTPATLTGTPGAVMPAGILVGDPAGAFQWATRTLTVLDAGTGTAEVFVDCTVVGPVTAPAGTLTRIITPVPGLASVTNAADAIPGRLAETNEELRRRRDRSTAAPASGPLEAIRANLLNIPGVLYARVYQNLTLSTDGRGIAARSIAPVVVGGDDEAIARVLLQRTGVGADWFGSSDYELTDGMGEAYTMRWTRPAAVTMFMRLTTSITDSNAFPFDGLQRIRDAVVAYSAGGAPALGITSGFNEEGFPPGGTVSRGRLWTPVNSVPGHVGTSIELSRVNLAGVDDVDVVLDWDEYPVFIADAGHIDIDVV